MEPLIARYRDALLAADGAAMAACCHKDARYHSALTALDSNARQSNPRPQSAQSQPQPAMESTEAEPDEDNSIPASALPSFFTALNRSLCDRRVVIHSTLFDSAPTAEAESLAPTIRRCFIEYTLTGQWSGRLPSMVVGVYDKPIRLRCIDCLTIRVDGSSTSSSAPAVIVESRVHLDRMQFLIQIGMARAML